MMATLDQWMRPGAPHDGREQPDRAEHYVGTIVGESTSREFRLALAQEAVREQDIIALNATARQTGGVNAPIRIWAKVQRIERLNPLFPADAGHELAATETDPFDTVLSLSRELITAVCQVLGTESLAGGRGGKLDHLRYPARPATSAYRPGAEDIARVVLGELTERRHRALDIATLANRPDVQVAVDGHALVTRHLAILAMTGAGKSWAARRVIEQLATKHYPIVIFDPHGDYTGLADVPALRGKVRRYFAQFPLFEEDAETVAEIVNALGYELTDTMRTRFGDLFQAAKAFVTASGPGGSRRPSGNGPVALLARPTGDPERLAWLAEAVGNPGIARDGVQPDMALLAHLAEAGQLALQGGDAAAKGRLQEWGWPGFAKYTATDARTLEAIKKRATKAAAVLRRMEATNRRIAGDAEPLPTDRGQLVRYGGISVVSLAGYTAEFQATIYSLVAEAIFDARVQDKLRYPALLVLEEAHTFVPGKAASAAERRAVATTKQIAQEGRKFGVGLLMISQRPSRLDETALSQCNSFIVMRMVNPADQQFVRRVIETLGEEEARMLPDLDVGEALLSGQLTNFPVLVRMKAPVSQGEREEQDAFEALEHARRGPARP